MNSSRRRRAYPPSAPPSTRSWTAIARRSHPRTPRNAYRVESGGASVTVNPSAVRSAVHCGLRGGCRNAFHDCGPAA